jgi:hypothetical protein
LEILKDVKWSFLDNISYKWIMEDWNQILKANYWENNKAYSIIEKQWLKFKLFKWNIDNTTLTLDELKNRIIELLQETTEPLRIISNELKSNAEIYKNVILLTNNYKYKESIFIPKKMEKIIDYITSTFEIYVRVKMLQNYMIKNSINFDNYWIDILYEKLEKWEIFHNDWCEWHALLLYKNQKENLLIILKDLI